MPAAVISIPATSAPRSGTRSDARPAAAETTKETSASGASTSPASTGSRPCTSSRNSVT